MENSTERSASPLATVSIVVASAALSVLTGMLAGAALSVGGYSAGGTASGQILAGTHVLWPLVAVALLRRRGVATATALLAGLGEYLTGSTHGWSVVVYSAFAGASIDVVWWLTRASARPYFYLLAGGISSAANVLIFKCARAACLQAADLTVVVIATATAFASGVLLAGIVGALIVHALRRIGIAGALALPSTGR
jgi:ABC-type thiamin/hydroxymethylpyrimidine transport system permease subunit